MRYGGDHWALSSCSTAVLKLQKFFFFFSVMSEISNLRALSLIFPSFLTKCTLTKREDKSIFFLAYNHCP